MHKSIWMDSTVGLGCKFCVLFVFWFNVNQTQQLPMHVGPIVLINPLCYANKLYANQINSQNSHKIYYILFDNHVTDSTFRRNIVKTKVFNHESIINNQY